MPSSCASPAQLHSLSLWQSSYILLQQSRLMLNNANEMSSLIRKYSCMGGNNTMYAKKKSIHTHICTQIHAHQIWRAFWIFSIHFSLNVRLTSVSASMRWGKYLSFVAICTVDSQRLHRHIHTHTNTSTHAHLVLHYEVEALHLLHQVWRKTPVMHS